MGVNSLPKTVTQQRRGCDLNPGPSVPESSTLTTRLSSQPSTDWIHLKADIQLDFSFSPTASHRYGYQCHLWDMYAVQQLSSYIQELPSSYMLCRVNSILTCSNQVT